MVTRYRLPIALAALSLIAAAAACPAQEARKGDEPKGPQNAVRLKLEKYKLASSINFARALKLPFESLGSLGQRIEQARRDADPVALAALANELGVAEKVSGKKADLTSAELEQEAVDLALLRGVPEELQALDLTTSDASAKSRIRSEIDPAQARKTSEAERAKAVASGERPRGLMGTLVVINGTDDELRILVNGVPRGRSFARSTMNINVFDPGPVTRLEAVSPFEGLKGFSTVEGNVNLKVFFIGE